ncbi:PAS domain S-box protein [Colwellia hornerae]|uniref:Sensory/regulatory protein RpfC n=1 Tax=Colwellia hornerae TaxID=89402 RepID=A0A5C6QRU0_9GAMM|nr:PAS domain S-box protein [Colwellia hornerae]TWX57653.1 PAS domain S-box protein [Colwellia hornerae]TWX62616.1 PAS domain S-box protein [Colwellia hornerae]TWX71527.1 PAS domain S-box protein [Colwellia hornerae]
MSRYANLYKSPLYLIAAVVVLFLIGSTIIGWYSLNKVESTLKTQAIEILTARVKVSNNLLENGWIKSHFSKVKAWSTSPIVVKQVKQLVTAQASGDSIAMAKASESLTAFLQPYLLAEQNEGFYVISPDYNNLSAKTAGLIGQQNIIAKQYPQRLAEVFTEQLVFIPPLLSEIPLINPQGKLQQKYPTTFIVAPILDNDQQVIAALAIRLNPFGAFSTTVQQHSLWKSEQTYFFDSKARLLTTSQFEPELRSAGLLTKEQSSILAISLTLPAKSTTSANNQTQPLIYTKLAQSALKGQAGFSEKSYLNYRGEPVLGAWLWNSALGLGIGAEVSEVDVLQSQQKIVYGLFWQLFQTALMSLFILAIAFYWQKRSAAVIFNSEQYLYSMLNNAPDAIISFNKKGEILRFNKVAGLLFLVDRKGAEAMFFNEFFMQNEKKHLQKWIQHITNDSSACDSFRIMQAKAGDSREFSARVAISSHKTSQDNIFTAIISDLSTIQQLEGRLLVLESAVEQSHSAILITNLNGRIVYVNKAFSETTGYSKTDVLGKNANILDSGHKNTEKYQQLWQKIIESQHWSGQLYNKKKDGSCYWGTTDITPIRDRNGKVDHFLAINQDITRQKANEDKLLKQQLFLKEAERIAHLGCWEKDLKNDAIYWSDGMHELIGIEKNSTPLNSELIVNLVHPEDRYQFRIHQLKALNKLEVYNYECRIILADKQLRYINTSTEVTRDEHGEPVSMLGIVRDITNIKQNEIEREILDAEKEQSRQATLNVLLDVKYQRNRTEKTLADLKESQQELEQARLTAEAASDSKSQFLATMSHEIRTPMNGVVGMLELLQQSELDDDQYHLANVAKDSAWALLQIINDVLDFSKIEAGKMTLESIPFTWTEIIEGAAELLSSQLQSKKLLLVCSSNHHMTEPMLGDPIRLRQIVFNLLGNAIKFTHSNDQQQSLIEVKLDYLDNSQDKKLFRLTVKDNGIGISDDQQIHLFDAFTQADSSTHRQFGGTGLGLSICSKLTTMMGGEISCQSIIGDGTEFHVDLPLVATEKKQTSTLNVKLYHLNILLIAHDGITDSILQKGLIELGAHCHLAPSSPTKLSKLIAIENYDLIIISAEQVISLWPEVKAQLPNNSDEDINILILERWHDFDLPLYPEHATTIASNPFLPQKIYFTIARIMEQKNPLISCQKHDIKTLSIPSIIEAQASNKLILIVEDNVFNQQVLERQLNLFGYAVIIANHGEEALAKMTQYSFALIMTDCQMPIMDGFEFAQKVRENEQSGTTQIPIIAITANAMRNEAEHCIKLGMNDYVTKPMKLDSLKALLGKWLIEEELEDEFKIDSPAELTNEQVAEMLEQPAINISALIECFGDDKEAQQSFLHFYQQHSKPLLAELAVHITDKDWHSVAELAHKLKSSTRSAGAILLGHYCEQLEQLAKEENAPEIIALSHNLYAEFIRVSDEISAKF